MCLGVYLLLLASSLFRSLSCLLDVLAYVQPSRSSGLRPAFSLCWSTPSLLAVLAYVQPSRSAGLRPAYSLYALLVCMVFTRLLLIMYQCLLCLPFSIFAIGCLICNIYFIYSIFNYGCSFSDSSCYHQWCFPLFWIFIINTSSSYDDCLSFCRHTVLLSLLLSLSFMREHV